MMRDYLLRLLLLMVLVSANQSGLSQNKVRGYAINPKVGAFGGVNDDGGMVVGVETNIHFGQLMYSIDYFNFQESSINLEPEQYYHQVAAMVGKQSGDGLFRFQYQAGLASISGIQRTTFIEDLSNFLFTKELYETEAFHTVGLVTKVGAKVVPTKFLSLGIDLQANINGQTSLLMPMFGIEIGLMTGFYDNPE